MRDPCPPDAMFCTGLEGCDCWTCQRERQAAAREERAVDDLPGIFELNQDYEP